MLGLKMWHQEDSCESRAMDWMVLAFERLFCRYWSLLGPRRPSNVPVGLVYGLHGRWARVFNKARVYVENCQWGETSLPKENLFLAEQNLFDSAHP